MSNIDYLSMNLDAYNQIRSNFHEIKRKESSSNPIRHFLDELDAYGGFWLEGVDSPDGPLAGVRRFYDACSNDPSSYFCSQLKNVPQQLRLQPNFVYVSPDKENKFSKNPHLTRGIGPGEELLKKNWVGFTGASLNISSDIVGLGYVMDGRAVVNEKKVVAITITNDSGHSYDDVIRLWTALGRPYLEHRFDCAGWTLLGLARQHIPTFETNGIRIWTDGGFVELCGLGARGELKDITDEVLALHAYRIPNSPKSKPANHPRPETPREVAVLKDQLAHIDADCHYDTYMRVVWAILSTGWQCAEQIALDWSMTAPGRFEQHTFNNLVRSYDLNKANSLTLGTIYHYARLGGWNG